MSSTPPPPTLPRSCEASDSAAARTRHPERSSPHRGSDHRAARRPCAVRLARLLSDEAVDAELLRRARRQRRYEPDRDAGPAQDRPGHRTRWSDHPASVLRPRPAALLQLQPDGRVALGRPDDRQGPDGVLVGDDLMFSAQVVGDPKAAIHEVWIVWTDGNGTVGAARPHPDRRRTRANGPEPFRTPPRTSASWRRP